ncbi:tRNA (adenosine(37)-N6)-dimethylallyltransferase MiaA [Balneolales bacterium ANBcel1]|nr:tRNA (adenosine(37)-N6)-dimethylallyltransferase MiaA [Balneolales bacterium ANBcel1]
MTTPLTVILTGPTATGKTDLALSIARYLDTPVVSADSRQCYRYLNIGTAKPPPAVLEEIPHYYISVLDPEETGTAADFAEKAISWKSDLDNQKRSMLVAGGSTLYIESLIRPLDPLPPKSDANIRELEYLAEKNGLKEIHRKLQEVDPDYAQRLDGLNPHRMFRALDVWMQTGIPFSRLHQNRDLAVPDNMLVFCLDRDRAELHERINTRVDQMFEAGLMDEVRSLLEMGYDPSLPSLRTVGYRECIECLVHQRITPVEAREQIKAHTRQYARRQLTWFRRWKGVQWLNQSDRTGKSIREEVIQAMKQLADHT